MAKRSPVNQFLFRKHVAITPIHILSMQNQANLLWLKKATALTALHGNKHQQFNDTNKSYLSTVTTATGKELIARTN